MSLIRKKNSDLKKLFKSGDVIVLSFDENSNLQA